MRLETTEDLYYGYEKRLTSTADSSHTESLKLSDERTIRRLVVQEDVNVDEEDYEDDDVFMDSCTAANNNSSSGCGSQSDSCDDKQSMSHEVAAATGHSTSGHESMTVDGCMKSASSSPGPGRRRVGRLLRRRLFPRSSHQLQWNESGYRTSSSNQVDGGLDADSSDGSSSGAGSCTEFVAKEKLVNLSHEKLRSFSTDLHSNSDGLRNRVLVESTLKKFFLQEIGSPPRTSLPSTPRKRSSVSASSPLTSSPNSPSAAPLSPAAAVFAYESEEDDSTRTLSDSIKRMRIMHSTPSSRTSLSITSHDDNDVDADVSLVGLDDYCMTDLAAVFHKFHCLTDLPIDTEF